MAMKQAPVARIRQNGRSVYRSTHLFDVLPERGVTMANLVRAAGCDYSFLYHVKKGRRGIPQWLVDAACTLLDMPESELFSDAIPPKPEKPARELLRKSRSAPSDFWELVEVGDDGECWEWQRGVAANAARPGYGALQWQRKRRYAHHVAFEIAHGSIPTGLWVLHTCDNSKCVNPAHLYAGTPSDNSQDRERRCRSDANRRRGSACSQAKFRESDIVSMRQSFASGVRVTDIARQYDTNVGGVWNIVHGRTWKHVPMPESAAVA